MFDVEFKTLHNHLCPELNEPRTQRVNGNTGSEGGESNERKSPLSNKVQWQW